jgi:drug/metabolite transporter (DMT)-like permease
VNLGINVIASFQPNIGTVAHFAGGLAGAALAFFFVPPRFELQPTTPSWARAAGIVCALLLAAGVGYALFHATQSSGEVAVLGVV